MPWNSLLVLPLLGGFLFLDWCFFTRFRNQRIEGNRLLLESLFCAVALTLAASVLVSWARSEPIGLTIAMWWLQHVLPADRDAPKELTSISAAICITAFLLSILLVSIINACLLIFRNVSSAAIYAAEAAGDFVMSLVIQANRRRKFITVQLSNGMVYMGYAKTSPNLKPESQFALIVGGIGFLDKDKLLQWKEFIISSWEKEKKGGKWRYKEESLLRSIVIIPTKLVENIHMFNGLLDREDMPPDLVRSATDSDPSGVAGQPT